MVWISSEASKNIYTGLTGDAFTNSLQNPERVLLKANTVAVINIVGLYIWQFLNYTGAVGFGGIMEAVLGHGNEREISLLWKRIINTSATLLIHLISSIVSFFNMNIFHQDSFLNPKSFCEVANTKSVCNHACPFFFFSHFKALHKNSLRKYHCAELLLLMRYDGLLCCILSINILYVSF